ncbi:biotinidase-like [Neocloeon triangulifer]|uniref:biotinidase-like n=1 Tax=Neocloeon triangulifer TaxID=2078957 RepID=UPI00286F1E56|nr:biotinidase-like [Neocloeon triangulifer]
MNTIATLFYIIAALVVLVRAKPSLNPLELKGFEVLVFNYTPLGWNYTDIDASILEANFNRIEAVPGAYNSSSKDTIYLLPEFSFTTSKVIDNRTLALLLSQKVPGVSSEVVPCVVASEDPDDLMVLRLSCMARDKYVFIVANLLEKVACQEGEECREDGFKIYSTAIVFDKTGFIVEKYRKFHLIDEPAFDKPPNQEAATFTTGSNITVGLFMGHDLLFSEPTTSYKARGIKHFMHVGAWKNKLPFGFSTSVQHGWHNDNDDFLAVSAYVRPELGYTGNGAYFPSGSTSIIVDDGPTAFSIAYYSVDETLLEAKEQFSMDKASREIITEGIEFSKYSSVPIPASSLVSNEVRVCHGVEFCCSLTYKTIQSADETHYQLLAFEGNRTALDGTALFPEQTCGLVACSGEDKMTCGAPMSAANYISFTQISLVGSFSSDKVIPITLSADIWYYPLQYLDYSATPNGNRFDVSYTLFDGAGFPKIKTFALSSTDYTAKNGCFKSYSASLVLILMSIINSLTLL